MTSQEYVNQIADWNKKRDDAHREWDKLMAQNEESSAQAADGIMRRVIRPADAKILELKKAYDAFKVSNPNEKPLPGYEKLTKEQFQEAEEQYRRDIQLLPKDRAMGLMGSRNEDRVKLDQARQKRFAANPEFRPGYLTKEQFQEAEEQYWRDVNYNKTHGMLTVPLNQAWQKIIAANPDYETRNPNLIPTLEEKETARVAAEKKLKADNLTQGTDNINNAFTPYDDNYYKAISQKYLDYYLPQVDDQYKKSNETLLYNLSRNGIFNSSAKTDAYAEADKIYGEQKQDIASKATSLSSDAKKYISDQKTSLLNQLNVTGGDPLQASGFLGKAPAAISVTAPTQPNFSPLANLFDNITSIAKNETNAAMLSNQYGGGAGYAGSFNKPLKSRGSSKFAD